jgi:hypothetical protein
VLMILIGVFTVLLFSRSEVETSILRTPGVMYQKQEDGRISNLYNFKVINKTNNSFPVTMVLEDMEGEIKLVGEAERTVEPQGVMEGVMFVILKREQLDGLKTKVKIGVYDGPRKIETVKTNFLGPAQ